MQGMRHLFDGYGMLAKFRFANGRVWVSNRFIDTNSWRSFRDSGKMAFSEFGTGMSFARNVWNMAKHYSGVGQGMSSIRHACESVLKGSSSRHSHDQSNTAGFTDNANVSVLLLPDGETAVAMTESVQGTYLVRCTTDAAREHMKSTVLCCMCRPECPLY